MILFGISSGVSSGNTLGKSFIHISQHQSMARFLCNTELYEIILQKSLDTRNILWVCSPSLGLGAHRVFSQEILKNPPADIRFIFQVNDFNVDSEKSILTKYSTSWSTSRTLALNLMKILIQTSAFLTIQH